MVIGGIQGGTPSKKTYIFSYDLNDWYEGPELSVPRSGASCGVLNERHVLVTGGYNNDGYLSSTEVKLLTQSHEIKMRQNSIMVNILASRPKSPQFKSQLLSFFRNKILILLC